MRTPGYKNLQGCFKGRTYTLWFVNTAFIMLTKVSLLYREYGDFSVFESTIPILLGQFTYKARQLTLMSFQVSAKAEILFCILFILFFHTFTALCRRYCSFMLIIIVIYILLQFYICWLLLINGMCGNYVLPLLKANLLIVICLQLKCNASSISYCV